MQQFDYRKQWLVLELCTKYYIIILLKTKNNLSIRENETFTLKKLNRKKKDAKLLFTNQLFFTNKLNLKCAFRRSITANN